MAENLLHLAPYLTKNPKDKENCKMALWGWRGPQEHSDNELFFIKFGKLEHALHSAGIPPKAEEFRALAHKLKLVARAVRRNARRRRAGRYGLV
jgi:hypothetical protein